MSLKQFIKQHLVNNEIKEPIPFDVYKNVEIMDILMLSNIRYTLEDDPTKEYVVQLDESGIVLTKKCEKMYEFVFLLKQYSTYKYSRRNPTFDFGQKYEFPQKFLETIWETMRSKWVMLELCTQVCLRDLGLNVVADNSKFREIYFAE